MAADRAHSSSAGGAGPGDGATGTGASSGNAASRRKGTTEIGEVAERIYPAERAKAFMDAVVAIAMTLLIMPLMESAAELSSSETSIRQWFLGHAGQLITFVISFLLIGMFWVSHHRVHNQVTRVSGRLLWLNIGWLLTIVWLPVATALNGHMANSDRVTTLVYIGSLFATSLLMVLMRVYLAFHPELRVSTAVQERRNVVHAASAAVLFVVAGVLTLLIPRVGEASLAVLWLGGLVRRLVAVPLRRWSPADGTGGVDPVAAVS